MPQRKISKLWIVVLYFIATGHCLSLVAQEQAFKITHFGLESGLSDHRITTLLEHSSGYVYVASYGGLDRFDGYHFFPIPLPKRSAFMSGSIGPYVIKLKELTDGRILIQYGIKHVIGGPVADIYNPRNQKITEIPSDSISNLRIKTTCNKNNTFGPNNESKVWDCNGNYFTNKNRNYNLVLNNTDTVDFKEINDALNRHAGLIPSNNFKENIYFRSYNGLLKINLKKTIFESQFSQGRTHWAYGKSSRAFLELPDQRILYSADKEPLTIIDPIKKEQEQIKNSKLSSLPFAMHLQNDSTVWMLNNSGQLLSINLNQREVDVIGKRNILNLHAISRQQQMLILALTASGLNILQLDDHGEIIDSFLILTYKNILNGFMLSAEDGSIWVGHQKGLLHVNWEEKKVIKAYRHENDQVDYSNAGFPNYKILSAPSIFVIHESADGHLYLGLEKGGLNILNPQTNTIQKFNKLNGLSDNTITGILSGDHGYWLSTFNGLSHFNPENENFRNYYTRHGISHNEFNRYSFFKSSSGINYFGNMNGIVAFNPKEIEAQQKAIQLLLSEVIYYDKSGKNEIRALPYPKEQNNFTIPSKNRACQFYFSLSDFGFVEGHRYAYKLISAKETDPRKVQWIQNGNQRNIRFEYLPAGKYKLIVKGTSADGGLSESLTINLKVKEYFYKQAWFIGLIFTLLSALGYSYYRIKLNQARQVNKIRQQLSSNLHDDVGSVLSGVAYQMELLEYSVEDENKPLVQNIASSSRKAMSKMRDVVWAINSNTKQLNDLFDRMNEFAEELLTPLNIQYQFEKSESLQSLELPGEVLHSILMIYKEFLTNSVKHAQATNINCKMSKQGKALFIDLKDNGIGFSNTKQNTGQGLKNMNARSTAMNGTLKMLHNDGFGIQVTIPIP